MARFKKLAVDMEGGMLIWWEKTVEYAFVAEIVRMEAGDEAVTAAPLAGREEAAGDAVVAQGSRFVLIEFKRNVASIETERRKFLNYELARGELKHNDKHHLFVFGEATGEPPRLALRYRTYFSGTYLPFEKVFNYGIDEAAFWTYLRKLRDSKFGSGRRSETLDRYALVAGVQTNPVSGRTGMVTVQSLAEYMRERRRELGIPDLERGRERGPDIDF